MSSTPLEIRNRVKDEYGGICSRCGSTDSLAVHHKNGIRSNNRMSNLVLLCINCHTAEHGGVKDKFVVGELASLKIGAECFTEVMVMNIKKSYGMVRYVVAPTNGTGETTVEKLTKLKKK